MLERKKIHPQNNSPPPCSSPKHLHQAGGRHILLLGVLSCEDSSVPLSKINFSPALNEKIYICQTSREILYPIIKTTLHVQYLDLGEGGMSATCREKELI